MNSRATVRMVGRGELDECPAAVAVDGDGSATFLVNGPVFRRLRPQEQRFILAHELGHWLLETGREDVADAFALGLTAGRQHRSLKSALTALASMEAVPYSRIEALYTLCLAIDKQKRTR